MSRKQPIPHNVLVLQGMCKQYRAPLFARMYEELAESGIRLRVAYSEPPLEHQARKDNVELPESYGLKLPHRTLARGRLLVQCPLSALRQADLVIVEHALKHAVNYPLAVLSRCGLQRLGYWTHGGTLRHPGSSILTALRRRSVLAADWTFAYTQGVAAEVIALGAPAERVTALGNAIDLSSFRAALKSVSADDLLQLRVKHKLPEEAEVALFCGSLYPGRGIDFLLRAGEHVVQRNPRFHLIVVGAGPLAGQLEDQARTRPWLHPAGSIFGDARAPYFRLSRLSLMPYLAGLGILDSMAAGLPYLVTGARSFNPEIEYLEDGVTGLATGDDPIRYGEAILGLLADPVRLHAMSTSARKASFAYSIEAMSANFSSGIRACLRAPCRALAGRPSPATISERAL